MEERLQKVLARAGFASRRGAETLMQEGRVTINGTVVKELGTKADPARDDIRVDGVRVKVAAEPVYIVLNKPRGVVTTRRDPAGRRTVMELVPGVSGLFPVGRLDLTTEGLILLTNDGTFAERVSHPRYEVPRVYHAKVRGIPDERTLERLRRGVRVKDEVMVADKAQVVEVDRHAWVEVTLHEGKQHEVKRLLEAVGHPVSKLRRVAFGPVTLRGLEPGQFRTLKPAEVAGLLRGDESPATPRRKPRRRPRTVAGKGRPPATSPGGRTTRTATGRRGEAGAGRRGAQGAARGGKTAGRTAESRAAAARTTTGRKASGRRAEGRTTTGRTDAGRATRKSAGRTTTGRTVTGGKAAGRGATGRTTAERKTAGRKVAGRKAAGRKPAVRAGRDSRRRR